MGFAGRANGFMSAGNASSRVTPRSQLTRSQSKAHATGQPD
jgi:hypothetical protein